MTQKFTRKTLESLEMYQKKGEGQKCAPKELPSTSSDRVGNAAHPWVESQTSAGGAVEIRRQQWMKTNQAHHWTVVHFHGCHLGS